MKPLFSAILLSLALNGSPSFARGETRATKNDASKAEPASTDADAWVNTMKSFLRGYLADQWVKGMKFSIESCRPNEMKLFQLLSGAIKSFTHTYRFQKDCDLDGMVELRLRTPMDVDLKTRNLGSVTRFKGQVTVTPAKASGMGLELKLRTRVEEGEAFEGEKKAAALRVDHEKTVGLNMLEMTLETTAQTGSMKLSEFRGKPSELSSKF
jgi:hypothetical protein